MTHLPQGKSITRTVRCKPKTCKVDAVVVSITQTADGAMLSLRALRHKQTFDVFIADLFDAEHWKAARKAAGRK